MLQQFIKNLQKKIKRNYYPTKIVFRKQVFWYLIISQISIFFLILFHYQTGGYSLSNTITILGIVTPIFAAYLHPIFKVIFDKITQKEIDEKENNAVDKTLQRFTYFALLTFTTIILILIDIPPRPSSAFDFDTLLKSLVLVESLFGFYIGYIVTKLISKD